MRDRDNNNLVCVSACMVFFIRLPRPQEPKRIQVHLLDISGLQHNLLCWAISSPSVFFLFFSPHPDFKMLYERVFQFGTYHQSSKHLACKTWCILFNVAVEGVGGSSVLVSYSFIFLWLFELHLRGIKTLLYMCQLFKKAVVEVCQWWPHSCKVGWITGAFWLCGTSPLRSRVPGNGSLKGKGHWQCTGCAQSPSLTW